MQLSIVIPCYNEAQCIEPVVLSWIHEISARISEYELIVVNDGSKDETPGILDRLSSSHPQLRVIHQDNLGHGPALLHGYRLAKGAWVFHTDSDAQFSPEDFWKLWELRQETPYILGYRINRQDPRHRLMITFFLRWFIRLVLHVPVRDSNVPYKLIRNDLLQDLLTTIPPATFAPSILLAVGARRRNIFIREVGVRHFPRVTGQTVLVPVRLMRACIRAFFELLRYP